MLSFHVKFVQTDRQTERWITVKQYAPDLSMRRHKNSHLICCMRFFFFQEKCTKSLSQPFTIHSQTLMTYTETAVETLCEK